MNRTVKNILVIIANGFIFALSGFLIGYTLEDELKDWVGLLYGLFGFMFGFVISILFLLFRFLK
ncbi:hypothetical protein GWK91_05140 [Virgibacillus sp. MSP4-1]|uniref:hypothetical protein n=1 Tax=Virgibacillus sp. MSP4-1 TaxID=2700081 RepID=UPI0003A89BC7|nr:hypothetical protein [Virgibacillus sp. MSP4-1]QHS22373.1 hypothetical protein GWK91_05140 [Virgibacillus sp. MSP4-1]